MNRHLQATGSAAYIMEKCMMVISYDEKGGYFEAILDSRSREQSNHIRFETRETTFVQLTIDRLITPSLVEG